MLVNRVVLEDALLQYNNHKSQRYIIIWSIEYQAFVHVLQSNWCTKFLVHKFNGIDTLPDRPSMCLNCKNQMLLVEEVC